MAIPARPSSLRSDSSDLKRREPRREQAAQSANKSATAALSNADRAAAERDSLALIESMREWHRALNKIEDEAAQSACGEISFLAGVLLVATEDALADLLSVAC